VPSRVSKVLCLCLPAVLAQTPEISRPSQAGNVEMQREEPDQEPPHFSGDFLSRRTCALEARAPNRL
jgi:hypothetical protein